MIRGTVELRSGRWEWSTQAREAGVSVTFKSASRPGDHMQNWTPSLDSVRGEIERLALDPVTRTWCDPKGEEWELSLETPRSWRRAAAAEGPAALYLVFRGVLKRRIATVPATVQLGRLTTAELVGLLGEAAETS